MGQIAESSHDHQKGKLPSQPELAKAVTILRSGKVVANGVSSKNLDDLSYDVGISCEEPK